MVDDAGNIVLAGPVPDEVAGEATLIATFYGPHPGLGIKALHELLYRRLGPKLQEHTPPDDWVNLNKTSEEKYGHCFPPPGRAAHDTRTVQVALNSQGNAAEAWDNMRQTLRMALYHEEEILKTARHAEALHHIWGYSLVYQAVLKEDVDPDAALDASIQSIGRLEPLDRDKSPKRLHPLESADVPGGKVWLLGTPDRGDGWAAGTLYCAMGYSEEQETLLNRFYGPAAVLLTP